MGVAEPSLAALLGVVEPPSNQTGVANPPPDTWGWSNHHPQTPRGGWTTLGFLFIFFFLNLIKFFLIVLKTC
jgi:hypothetical protein